MKFRGVGTALVTPFNDSGALDEAAHGLLLRIYAGAGRTAMLTRQYNELCRVLDEELGAQPSRQTRDLYQRLIQSTTLPIRRAGEK